MNTNRLLGYNYTELIKQSLITLTSEEDKLVWTKTSDDIFSIKSAWKITRQRGHNNFRFKKLWHPQRPFKISIFTWKVLNKAVPIDLLVQRRGIPLASKCCCCQSIPNLKSVSHLFLFGETIAYIWEFYANALLMRCQAHTLSHILQFWWMKAKPNSLHGWLCNMLPPFDSLERPKSP